MNLPVPKDSPPLELTAEGVVRVGGTRVTLDTVVAAFQRGATAEEIQQRYPVLRLGDVYATIGYYLHQKEWVEEYLRQRERRAAEIRTEVEARFDTRGIRDRLLARRG